MKKIENILIANLASPANPGDQAILRGSIKLCKQAAANAGITVATRAFSQRKIYEDLGCRVVPSFPNVDVIGMDDSAGKLARVPAALSGSSLLREAVKQSDMVLLAGGAYFYSYRSVMPGLTYLAHLSPVYWAHRFGKPVVMLPQSYGPFRSVVSKKMFQYALDRTEKVYFREDISGDFLKSSFSKNRAKYSFMPDLAIYLEKDELLHFPKTKKNIIGVTLRPWKEGGSDAREYVHRLEEALLKTAAGTSYKIRIIVQVQDEKSLEGDESISRYLRERLLKHMKEADVEFYSAKPFFSLPELCGLYAECEVMISMRLHSALLSFILGTPALVAGYQHKAKGILERLGLNTLYAGSYSEIKSESLAVSLNNLLQDKTSTTKKIARSLEEARDEISRQIPEMFS